MTQTLQQKKHCIKNNTFNLIQLKIIKGSK